ncbi:MAG: metallophosphoesterase [Oscillospiraceae bacterium]|nr:metallophosphoesterase [Oscillospiraceae bacterium]
MSIFVIGDLHLSFGTQKPMDIFSGWQDHWQRIEKNWRRLVKDTDTVIIPGDVSWGLTLDEAQPDFRFIQSLPGKKIISKGNHDYWWQTAKKLQEFLDKNGFDTISFLHNNSFEVENYIICGTRGWIFENGQQQDEKVILREAGRLKASLDYMDSDKEKIVFLHYPTIYQEQRANHIINTLKQYNIKRCFYGHLHGKTINYAFNGVSDGIKYKLISADAIDFCPYIID